jgi:DNA-binding Lrp family transcriptional regulator
MSSPPIEPSTTTWTFVTNHAAVLLCIARDPEIRLRDVAQRVGITERAAQRIVRDLVEEGYVERRRVGRRNTYAVVPDRRMRHPVVRHHEVGALLRVLAPYAI